MQLGVNGHRDREMEMMLPQCVQQPLMKSLSLLNAWLAPGFLES